MTTDGTDGTDRTAGGIMLAGVYLTIIALILADVGSWLAWTVAAAAIGFYLWDLFLILAAAAAWVRRRGWPARAGIAIPALCTLALSTSDHGWWLVWPGCLVLFGLAVATPPPVPPPVETTIDIEVEAEEAPPDSTRVVRKSRKFPPRS